MAESDLKKCQCPLAAGLKVFDGTLQKSIEVQKTCPFGGKISKLTEMVRYSTYKHLQGLF
jgi:hypothetical protein